MIFRGLVYMSILHQTTKLDLDPTLDTGATTDLSNFPFFHHKSFNFYWILMPLIAFERRSSDEAGDMSG